MQNRTIWNEIALLFVGLWLIAGVFSFSGQGAAASSNDSVCGILILLFAFCMLRSSREWPKWALALTGVWLQFAPLLFWVPEAITYLNDTLCGVLVITFAVLLKSDRREECVPGGGIPPGWSYNPSAWPQRLPIIFLSFCAWMFARYMAAYQLGYLESVYDPLFGDGTLKVITSNISKAFPVADAGLGAMAYTLEMLMGAHGGSRRWHTIPWFVILFAILVVPLGFTSIVLIMLQPIVVGHWCFWCLLTALCMLFMIALTMDEVIAVCCFMKEHNWSRNVLLRGGESIGAKEDLRTKALGEPKGIKQIHYGVSFPWNLWICALLGLWLMFSPKLLEMSETLSDLCHIFGALATALSLISMAEVVRALRFANLFFAGCIALSALLASGWVIALQLAVALFLALFSVRKGPIYERYGSWERKIV